MAQKKAPSKKTAKKSVVKKAVVVEEQVAPKKNTLGPWIALLVMILLVAAVLLIFTLGPQLKTQSTKNNYNNYNFELLDDLWVAHLEINTVPYAITFHYHPMELERIPVQTGAADVVRTMANNVAAGKTGQQLYIALNPDDPADLAMAAVDIAKVTGEKFNIYNIPTKVAMVKASPNVSIDTPIVTCADANKDTLVLWIKTKGENLVALAPDNQYCIVLQATTANESIMVADRFIYELFGIMTETS